MFQLFISWSLARGMNGVRYRKHIFTKIWFLDKTYVIVYIQDHFVSKFLKGENHMYLTVKQQVKHLSKEDYLIIKGLCHTAKNPDNQTIYNMRQYYFTEGEFLKYEKNYTLLKNVLITKYLIQIWHSRYLKRLKARLSYYLVSLNLLSRVNMLLRIANYHTIFLKMDMRHLL